MLPLTMMFVASKLLCQAFFSGSIGYLASHSLRVYLIRLVLQQELGSFRRWPFVRYKALVQYFIKWYLQHYFNSRGPPLFITKDPAFPLPPRNHQPTILNNSSSITVQAPKSGRCLNIRTSPITRTLLTYRISMLLPTIGLHS